MQISLKTWQKYKNRLASIDEKAVDEMLKFLQQIGGFGDHAEEVIRYAYALSNKYGEAAAAAACEMYDAVAEASGVNVPLAEPAEMPDYKEVARAVNGTVKNSSESMIPKTVGRLVKRAGADTTLKNAMRDGAQFAWVPTGDTCAFCLTLASRGWQYASKKALKNGHAEHIHGNCDCQYAIRFDDKTNIQGYDPDKYLEMYNNADGKSPKDKINSLRRIKYQENKDRINAQKRAAYAKKKEYLLSNKNGIINYAKGIEIFDIKGDIKEDITPNNIYENLSTSKVGMHVIEYLDKNNIKPVLDYVSERRAIRGEQQGKNIVIYINNIKTPRVAAQTIIHEATHQEYNIGGSQLAEAICFGHEKMHIMGRDYLTLEEWNNMVNLAKENYPELPEQKWTSGGLIDYEKYIRIIG